MAGAQVQIGSTILKLTLLTPLSTSSAADLSALATSSLTISDVINEAKNTLLREYSPHLLSCHIDSLSYRTKIIPPHKLLSEILHGHIHHLIFVATEFSLSFYLLKPLGIKFIHLKPTNNISSSTSRSQLLIGKVLEIDEVESQQSQNCIHDLLVRGMEVISFDEKTDPSAMLASICDPSLNTYRLDVRYPGKAMLGNGMSGGYREIPLRLLQIHLSSIDGLRERVGVQETYYCVVIVGNNEYTQQTPPMKGRNGKLSLRQHLSVPVSYSSTTVRVELYQSNLLKSDVLIGHLVLKLRDLNPKGDTILQLPLQGTAESSTASTTVSSLLPSSPLRRDSRSTPWAPITVYLTCTLPSHQMISLLEEIAPRRNDLLFYQQSAIGSSSLKGIYAEDFYFVNNSLRLGQATTTAHDISLYISNLFFHPPAMKRKLSPCMFVIQNSVDERQSDSFGGGNHFDPALRVSTRVATMMTGSLKRLYSPEQVCNTLSVCLYSDQLNTNFTTEHPSLTLWTNTSLKTGEYSFKITLVSELSLTLECPPEKGYEFIANTEETYWDWFEALSAAFAIRNRVWTDDSLTFTEDLSGVLTWRKWKIKTSLSSNISYEVKEKLVSCAVDVKSGTLTLQIPKTQGTSTRYQAVTLTRDSVYSIQFSHSLQERFQEQIKLSVEGAILPRSFSERGPPSYELQASIGGLRLTTKPSESGHWNSNFYFSTNGCNVRHGWFPPADVSFQLYQTDSADRATDHKQLIGSASLHVATGESCSDFHKHTANSRRLSIYHKNSIERTLSNISSPPTATLLPMIPDSSQTEGIRIQQMSLICPREYPPLKKGVYLVLHLVSKSKGLIKTSKMRTPTLFREVPQWDSEIVFRSEKEGGVSNTLSLLQEYSGICIRLMQHGKLRSTLLHEYLLGLGNLSQSPSHFTLHPDGQQQQSSSTEIPELRVSAGLMLQEATRDEAVDAVSGSSIGLVYQIDSCQLDEDNCAWSATIFYRPTNSPRQATAETEECHVHIGDNGLSVISSSYGVSRRLEGTDDSLFFLEAFTSLRDLSADMASGAQTAGRVSIKQITAYVLENQPFTEGHSNNLQLGTSSFCDICNQYPFPFRALEEATLPDGYAWSSKWFFDPHKKSDTDGWVYGSSHWAIASGYGTPVPSRDSTIRVRVWKRYFLRNAISQAEHSSCSSTLSANGKGSDYVRRDVQYGSLEGDKMFTYEDRDTADQLHSGTPSSSSSSSSASSSSGILRSCVPSVHGCVHIPFSAVMSVVVLCPTVIKCVAIVDILQGGHICRAPLKILIGSCPAVQIASLIQDHHSLLPIRRKMDDLKQLKEATNTPEQVLEITRVIIHSLSALEDYTYECSPFVRNQIVKRRHRLIGCLMSLRRRYSHLFSDLFDVLSQESLENQADLAIATVTPIGGVEEIIETVKRCCGALSEMLRKVVISQPQGSDADTRAYVEATVSNIVNIFYSRIVETIGAVVSNRDGVSKLKGQSEKLQLLFFVMKEDDVVDRILKRYLPLLGFENFPAALLTMVIGIDGLIGRFTNVMEDEVKVFCDRVLNYHLSEGAKAAVTTAVSSSFHAPWVILCREKMFQSSLPEDIVSAVRLFIESVMQDYGAVDEGGGGGGLHGQQRAAQLRLDLRPKRGRGKKNVATADGSQHSKFRVLQFQGHILGAIASTLVWLRDALSSIVTSSMWRRGDITSRESAADDSELLRAQYNCSVMNDCVRLLTIHLPAMETDFDSILSEALSSGVSLNSAYVAFFELLQQCAQRIASSIFEDVLRIFDITSSSSSEGLSRFASLWLRPPDENEEKPFSILCSVSATALTCLRDWLHPSALSLLLSEVFSSITTLLLFVAKEVALTQPDLLLSTATATEEEDMNRSEAALRTLTCLCDDITLVRNLFSQFSDRDVENNFAIKLAAVTGITILSGREFLKSLCEFEAFLIAAIPDLDVAGGEKASAGGASKEGSQSNLLRCFMSSLEEHRLFQGSVSGGLKCALLLRPEPLEDRRLIWSMLTSTLMDREISPQRSKSRKQKPHYDLFARVFGDMTTAATATAVPNPTAGNPSAVSKTINFLRKAVTTTGIPLELPSSDAPWFLYQRCVRRDHRVLTADDILLTFSQWSAEEGGGPHQQQERALNLLSVHSLSSALLEIGRQVVSSPTKQTQQDHFPTGQGQLVVIQVVEARGLQNSELVGKSSPYVTIQLIRSGSRYRSASATATTTAGGGDGEDEDLPLRQTSVVHHKLDPFFGESFRFLPADLAGLQLEVKVWSWSRYFRHALLGCKTVAISGISSSRYEDFWVDLEPPVGAGVVGMTGTPTGVGVAVRSEDLGVATSPGAGAGGGSGSGRVHLVITLPKKSDLLE